MSDLVVTAARSWIGTPYRHRSSVKGVGCDCLGLVRGVWRDVIGPEPEEPPIYQANWTERAPREMMIEGLSRNMTVVTGETEPGDVIVFRMRPNRIAKHCAIYVGDDRIVHSYDAARVVSEHYMGDYWHDKIVAKFRFPV